MSKAKRKNGDTGIEDFLLPEKDTIEGLPLPSGLLVTFKRPSLAFHIALGEVPGRVANAIVAAHRGDMTLEAAAKVEPDPEETERRAEIAAVYCLLKPKFSFKPGPGEFDVRRMQPLDKMRVYQWAMRCGGGGVDLESFRTQEPGGFPADGANGEAKRPAAEPISEKPGVGV